MSWDRKLFISFPPSQKENSSWDGAHALLLTLPVARTPSRHHIQRGDAHAPSLLQIVFNSHVKYHVENNMGVDSYDSLADSHDLFSRESSRPFYWSFSEQSKFEATSSTTSVDVFVEADVPTTSRERILFPRGMFFSWCSYPSGIVLCVRRLRVHGEEESCVIVLYHFLSCLARIIRFFAMINNSPTHTVQLVILTAIILCLSSSQQQCHPIIVVVDAMKLTSLGSSMYGSSSGSKQNTNHDQGKIKTEHGNRADEVVIVEEDSGLECSSSIIATTTTTTTTKTCSTNAPSSYGVDRSFPIHHPTVLFEDEEVGRGEAVKCLPNKQQFYTEYMEGCRQAYHPEGYRCDISEEERIDMNLRQPASMFVSCCFSIFYRMTYHMEHWKIHVNCGCSFHSQNIIIREL